jgi:hypothetical protein
MKELFYYSIFAVILYFVLTAIFDNFTLEQENFDPSLVPVSSIITLAKVAQKLVNGNGTLTNPGNLQIGSSTSAPGNLTVTGNANINGTLFVGNENIVKIITDRITALSTSLTTNALTVNGNASVTGDLTVKGTNILDTINGAISTLGNSFKTNTLEVTGATHFTGYGQDTWLPFTDGNNYLRKNVIIDQGNLSVTKNVNVGGNLTIGSKGMFYGNGDPYANDGWVRLMKSDGSANYVDGGFATSNLYSQLDTTVNRNLQVNGNATINGKLTVGNLDAVSTINALNYSINLLADRIATLEKNISVISINFPKPLSLTMIGVLTTPTVRAPLFYGWNFTWDNNDWKDKMKNTIGWNGQKDNKYYSYGGGYDLRNPDLKTYSFLPGYKFQMYGWKDNSQMVQDGPEYTGDKSLLGTYDISLASTYGLHIIAVRKIDETWALPNIIPRPW